jgi:hypothetical protein
VWLDAPEILSVINAMRRKKTAHTSESHVSDGIEGVVVDTVHEIV